MRKTEIKADWLTVTANPSEIYQPNSSRYYDEFYQRNWSERAEKLLDDIAARLKLGEYIATGDAISDGENDDIRVQPRLAKKGYKAERQYKKVAMGYHPLYEYMGICIEFSGEALQDYRNLMKDVELVEPYILRTVADLADAFESARPGVMFSSKCTRIDIAIDEFGSDYTVTDFINEYYHRDRVITSEQVSKQGEVYEKPMNAGKQIIQNTDGGESLYIGSLQSTKRMNIYNKVAERINAGEEVDEETWVRFEARFRKEYALQIGNRLLGIRDAFEGLKTYYAIVVANYGFKKRNGKDHELVAEWRKRSKGMLGVLQSEDRRKSTFETSYEHIAERSGLFSLMKKAELLHGVDAVDALVKALMNDYAKYKATDDVNKFVHDHAGEDWEEAFPSGWKHQMEEIRSEQSGKKRG